MISNINISDKPKNTVSARTVSGRQPSADSLEHLLQSFRLLRDQNFGACNFKATQYWAEKCYTLSSSQDAIEMARLWHLTGENHRAIHLLLRHTDNVQCKLLLIKCYINVDKLEECSNLLSTLETDLLRSKVTQTLHKQPQMNMQKILSQIKLLKGRVSLVKSDYDKAKAMFSEALKIDPTNTEALIELSEFKCYDGDYKELLGKQKISVGQGPVVDDVVSALSEELVFQSVCNKYPKLSLLNQNLDHLYTSSLCLYDRMQITECRRILEKALNRDSFHQHTIILYINCLYLSGNDTELFSFAHRLVDDYGKCVISWYAIGCYYLLVKKNLEARQYFGEATSIDGKFAHVWLAYGLSFAFEGEHDQAIAAFSTAMRLSPFHYIPPMMVGLQYSQIRQFEHSLSLFKASLSLKSKDPFVHNEIGVVYYRIKDYAKSVHHFKEAYMEMKNKVFDPHLVQGILSNWGKCLLKQRKISEAKEKFTMAYDLCPNDYGCALDYALILHMEGKLEEAIELYHQVLLKYPDSNFATAMMEKALMKNVKSSIVLKNLINT